MTAHAVVTQAIQDAKALRINTSVPRQAGAILGALHDAGYAVVKVMYDPISYEVTDEGQVRDVVFNEFYSPMEADILAARLLGAVEKATS